MNLKKSFCLLILVLTISTCAIAQDDLFPFVTKTDKVSILYDKQAPKLDSIIANLLAEDIERVTSCKPRVFTELSQVSGNVIAIGSIQSAMIRTVLHKDNDFTEKLKGKWESFGLNIINKPTKNISKALVIAGSDPRGTAFGVFTISEKIGVSPWYWWADAPVKKSKELILKQKSYVSKPPAVKYRGIFINDEDWGLQPWAAKTFEPETGDIGPKTYAKVFELLLRLKANLIWPAMHPSTKAFFHYPGNRKTAEDYQIVIGSSHAEPMLRNNVDEWDTKAMGHFNYLTNKKRILQYWEERIQESKGIDAIYTLGMRGIHDGQMEGVNDLKEAVPLIQSIIHEERTLLSKYINKDVTAVPQVLTPYKEVLEIYDHGLKVPDDVTLVWPDDNYGYIHRLNNEQERNRTGGAGVYYHASYWGRPHDYLWLPSMHPALMAEEMIKAYETGARTLWVLNVGDIKPQEYNIQQFLDMAFNPAPFQDGKYTQQHLLHWTQSIFGAEKAPLIQSILWKYYQLAFERRPEFMGWSQTEPNTETTYTDFNHFYYGDEAQKRIDQYQALELAVSHLRKQISPHDADAFFQLVYYPVIGASQINKKFLYRDKSYFYSKQNRISAHEYARLAKKAYERIIVETTNYNTKLAKGKWKHIMSMKPRDLAVYQEPVIAPIHIDSVDVWDIAPEGLVTKDSSLLTNQPRLSLPPFDVFNKQRYFVDVFLKKSQPMQWKASVSHPWIRLSKMNGQLFPDSGKNQVRLWVDIDWKNINKKESVPGSITITGGGKQIVLSLSASNPAMLQLANYKGFVENNGFVSIHANHFNRQNSQQAKQWKVIPGLGYTENAIQAFPLTVEGNVTTDLDAMKKNGTFVAYDFYNFTETNPSVTIFALPTHPINNNYQVRYAVSIDDGPLKMVDIRTVGRSEEWKQNVLRNRAERKIEMPFLKTGKHQLKIFCVDPGVIIDEIRIDLGGLKKAYRTVPETYIKKL
uniref:Gylcosyl hydrolase 115 C-terminal domain-containing protein n=1 Tax=Sphingobacterium sp. (strain 21) TaxID=743722 RepID=F4C6N9_SPHS2